MGVTPTTISRWKSADRKAGIDWAGLRDERRRKDPHALIAILEQRLMDVAQDADMKVGPWADIIQKVSNVLNRERERLGDVSTILGVLQEFAAWAAEHAGAEDLATLQQLAAHFLADLKRRHT